jgi:outer membrane protein
MNRKSLILVSIPVVFIVLSIASCSKFKQKSSDSQGTVTEVSSSKNGKIAYVEIDSIFKHYDLANDERATLETKQKQLDADLSSKSKSFQSEVNDFQNKVQKGLITQSNAQDLQRQLSAKEQDLYQLRDQYRGQAAEDAQVTQRKILQSVMSFLKTYNQEKGFQYILANSFPGNILYADSTLNITNEVIKGLNASYKKDSSKDKVKK